MPRAALARRSASRGLLGRFSWCALRVLALSAALAQHVLGKEERFSNALPERLGTEVPPFFDYDCDLAATTRTASTDWNAVYDWVASRVADFDSPDFRMSERFRPFLEGPVAGKAAEECPLGVLYFSILAFYDAQERNVAAEMLVLANKVQSFFSLFSVYTVALSRWPVFYALQYFSVVHTQQPSMFCEDKDSQELLDWIELRDESKRWATLKWTDKFGMEIDSLETQIAAKFFTMLRSPANHALAQDECEYGFYFLVASQVVAAANRETHHLPPFNKVMDHVMANIPFVTISSSGWPIFAVLVIFSDLNKGMWFFGGDRKYLRGYSDWNLRSDELAPLVPSHHGFLSHGWRGVAEETVSALLGLPAAGFAQEVHTRALRREQVDGPLRPIVRTLIDAALAIAAAQVRPPPARRLAYVVFLYGAKWSALLPRLAARLQQLGIEYPLLAISIGLHAANVCRQLSAGSVAGAARVVCWSPDSQSQVHRFTPIHGLLHLGIDVVYMDMDTFLLQDPTPRILRQAEGFDALFARHADADCVNIGVFYIRSTPETAVWLSQFLAWYHDHPFEIDQRGLHVFLGLPAEKIQIAYPPQDLVRIRGGVLEDVNEVVIWDIGWHGDVANLLIFHWCHRPIEQKEAEIWAAYDAADAAAKHGLALAPALAAATPAMAGGGDDWAKVRKLRAIVESYRKDAPPERIPCW